MKFQNSLIIKMKLIVSRFQQMKFTMKILKFRDYLISIFLLSKFLLKMNFPKDSIIFLMVIIYCQEFHPPTRVPPITNSFNSSNNKLREYKNKKMMILIIMIKCRIDLHVLHILIKRQNISSEMKMTINFVRNVH